MISCNASEVQSSLLKVKAEIEKGLTGMVEVFAGVLAQAAAEGTKIGDTAKYAEQYKSRFEKYGIEPRAGFHAGSWTYSESGNLGTLDVTIYEVEGVKSKVRDLADGNYKLGETFYIAAQGPAFGIAIKMEDIQLVYSADFKQWFDNSRKIN